jgi:hypothetical protein
MRSQLFEEARPMSLRLRRCSVLVACVLGLTFAHAAAISKQQADDFDRKVNLVNRQATGDEAPGLRRTSFSEAEVNSWFAYSGREVLPVGVVSPKVTILADGLVKAEAIVDLEAIARRRTTGRTLDPWSYLGGRVPVTASGILRTQNGKGRFDLDQAAVSGVPIPKAVLQDMVTYYSRTVDAPQGVRLDEPFQLPARIRQIELRQGQAVVVQ